jgi:hypothetical protein
VERGKAQYAVIATGSNTTIKASAGSLYAVHINPGWGGTVKINGSSTMGQATDMNSISGDTIGLYGPFSCASNTLPPYIDFGPGVGFTGLTVAATSNSRVTVIYE